MYTSAEQVIIGLDKILMADLYQTIACANADVLPKRQLNLNQQNNLFLEN